jgi:uncharacterized protein (DUF362 family)
MPDHAPRPSAGHRRGLTRRRLLAAAGLAATGLGVAGAGSWWRRNERGWRAPVFIGRAADYHADLTRPIRDGLAAVGVTAAAVRGKRILLKPNLVETARGHAHINTHPAVVVAAAEAFRSLGAASVLVAEGQGHRRDSMLVLEESRMLDALDHAGLPFIDLNHADVAPRPNAGRWSSLESLHLPRPLLAADLIVSMPKLKTHHWAGVTCSMKNLFGVMPGIIYGWPKNVLHWNGIHESILDINATVRPALAIVDGIIGMEGDGPIMGTPRSLGCIVIGANLPAVDATCTRLMELNPTGVDYLVKASGRLGPVQEQNIAQRGEPIAALRSRFRVIDAPHLARLTAAR